MGKYKVVVYAISKNEEKFVDRWYDSMKEADSIYVLDTGSKDATVDKLKGHGVNVVSKDISPWRFDVARNCSIEMIPDLYDIYVCTDLDEILEKGWREKLENSWHDGVTRARYTYNWQLDKNDKPLVSFYTDKIHIRSGYKWIHPVHEVLSYSGNENVITIEDIVLNHYPDIFKERTSYLPLLELSVKEDPYDDRNMHYLGREYMYHSKWNECIDTLIKHLSLPKALWKDERCASMRYISRAYKALGRINEARMWLKLAIEEATYLRDPWVELGMLEYEEDNYVMAIYYIEEALKIRSHAKTYINEKFSWNEVPYDILSICYYNIYNYDKALENVNKAITFSDEERLIRNKELIEKEISEDKE